MRVGHPINNGGAFVDGEHRYHLWRSWSNGAPSVVWVMLNPSTADARIDDPTVRKCCGFARRWGYGSIDIVNLYTLRTHDPKVLNSRGYPNGQFADASIRRVLAEYAKLVVYAWGTKCEPHRPIQVDKLIRAAGFRPTALRVTNDGHPGHPLYLPNNSLPVEFQL